MVYSALDGLRAFAVSWVLFSHFWIYPVTTPIVNRFAAAGWAGVDLFFVLSGFLITRILIRDEKRPDYFRAFYLRRAKRIVPIYYLVLLIVLVGFPVLSSSSELLKVRSDWAWYVGFLSNVRIAQVGWSLLALDVTWSLAIEEQFYLVWPAAYKWLRGKPFIVLCATLIIALPIVRIWLYETRSVGHAWLDLFTVFRADNLAVGALLALAEKRLPRYAIAGRCAFVASLGAIVWLVAAGELTRMGAVTVAVGHTLLAILAASIIQAAVSESSRLASVFSFSPLRRIGTVSYGMYLYQGVVFAICSAVLARVGISIDALAKTPVLAGVFRVLLISTLTYIVARISFGVIEEPILRRRAPKPSAASVPSLAEV